MTRKKTINIDDVLDAAEAVILEVGHHRLTLNLVAEKAGISRGGLAYSFPAKDDLLRAATRREMSRFMAALATLRDDNAPDHAAILARIAVTRSEDEKMIARAASLLAMLLQADEDAAQLKHQWRAELDALGGDSPESRRARVAFWAVEGLFFLRGLGFLDLDRQEWERSLDDVRDMYLGKIKG